MVYKEMEFAIEYMKDNMPEWGYEADIYCAESCYGKGDWICTHPEGYVFKTAIEALEKQIEYRWHNLLDDPKDLPCDMDSILVEVKYGDGNRFDTGYYNTKYSRFSLKCTSPAARIIRWKKIDKEG